jgi:hypothetical protein
VQVLAAVGKEPLDAADGLQIEGERTLIGEVAEADRRRDQQRVADT